MTGQGASWSAQGSVAIRDCVSDFLYEPEPWPVFLIPERDDANSDLRVYGE
jgi:hypothetical protein